MLVAEDREEEIDLLKMAFDRAKLPCNHNFVRDGAQVMEYLIGGGSFANRAEHPLPTVLLLDLKMPRMNGFEVLEWLRKRKDGLRRLPVIVFTSSMEPEHINRAYDLGANSYIVKPIEFNKLIGILREVEIQWFETIRLPDCTAPATE